MEEIQKILEEQFDKYLKESKQELSSSLNPFDCFKAGFKSVSALTAKEMEKPIGDFILENTDGSFMTTNDGRYYHYADVCLLFRKYHQAKLKNHSVIGDDSNQREQFFALLKYAMPTNYKDLALERIVERFINESK